MVNDGAKFYSFRFSLDQMIGAETWGFAAGSGTGTIVSLDVGGRIRREKPLTNPHLTAEQREFDSEFGVFVRSVWRLDSKAEIVCGCWDDNTADGPMLAGLRKLVDTRITSVDLLLPGLDLTIGFDDRLWLRIFCDQVSEVDAVDNYSLFTPSGIYTVGTRSRLEEERR